MDLFHFCLCLFVVYKFFSTTKQKVNETREDFNFQLILLQAKGTTTEPSSMRGTRRRTCKLIIHKNFFCSSSFGGIVFIDSWCKHDETWTSLSRNTSTDKKEKNIFFDSHFYLLYVIISLFCTLKHRRNVVCSCWAIILILLRSTFEVKATLFREGNFGENIVKKEKVYLSVFGSRELSVSSEIFRTPLIWETSSCAIYFPHTFHSMSVAV